MYRSQPPSGFTRRQLIATSLTGLVALHARAQAPLDAADHRAIALGFSPDHRRVDIDRWPKKGRENPEDPQRCGVCAQRNAEGGCDLFGGRLVPTEGWCNAWTTR